jgi:hypothetical protein
MTSSLSAAISRSATLRGFSSGSVSTRGGKNSKRFSSSCRV